MDNKNRIIAGIEGRYKEVVLNMGRVSDSNYYGRGILGKSDN